MTDSSPPDPDTGDATGLPELPDSLRQAAKLAPDHWIGLVDPQWEGEGVPPLWAVTGEWRTDEDGEPVEWRENEEYRPSPAALGLPDPLDPVDRALQRAVTGYGPAEDVPARLAAAQVAVFSDPSGDLLATTTVEGHPVVPVYSSPAYARAAGPFAFRVLGVPELVDQLPPEHRLYVNPTAPVSMMMEPVPLAEAIAAAADAADEEENEPPETATDPFADAPPADPEEASPTDSDTPPRTVQRPVETVSAELPDGT
ncbi:type VII secretion system-associated protein [Streptomyces sp. NPDC035033]|uniref:type VII secretion system-associated protein n=1 Tax=Streptomyces sp. NPDC035033 TaxID=3155368 RepID=UPI0033FF33D9